VGWELHPSNILREAFIIQKEIIAHFCIITGFYAESTFIFELSDIVIKFS
jgi:hypothetical protein